MKRPTVTGQLEILQGNSWLFAQLPSSEAYHSINPDTIGWIFNPLLSALLLNINGPQKITIFLKNNSNIINRPMQL